MAAAAASASAPAEPLHFVHAKMDYGMRCYRVDPPITKTSGDYSFARLEHLVLKDVTELGTKGPAEILTTLEDIQREGDGFYTWVYIEGRLYASKYAGSGPEFFTKHLDLFAKHIVDNVEEGKQRDANDYTEYITPLVAKDSFFSGEMRVEGDTIYVNLFSGTFMLPTMGAYVDSHPDKFDTEDQKENITFINEKRLESAIEVLNRLQNPASPVPILGENRPYIEASLDVNEDILTQLNPYFQIRLFQSREECENASFQRVQEIHSKLRSLRNRLRLFLPGKMLENEERAREITREIEEYERELEGMDERIRNAGIRFQPKRNGGVGRGRKTKKINRVRKRKTKKRNRVRKRKTRKLKRKRKRTQ